MTINALWHGCIFGHSKDTLWVNDHLQCQRCWEPIPILVKGTPVPKGEPAVVRGVPKTKVHRESDDKVVPFERQSQR